ncbi:MAG: adenylate/guanylate cyclase domain-containing protein, partial [Calditrichaeota bacterium]
MDWSRLAKFTALSITALLFAYLVRYTIPALESLELKTLDWRFEVRGPEPVDDTPIVLVTIDDYSFEALPERWPWPRSYYAKVVENLTRAGARVIGLDVILDLPDQQRPEHDRRLAEALRTSGKTVLARKLEIDARITSYRYLVDPLPLFAQAADSSLGLVSIESDPDGIFRRYPVAQTFQEDILPSFALEMLRKYKGYEPDTPIELDQNVCRFGEFRIPLNRRGTLLIDFAGPRGTFPHYSFASVMDDSTVDLGEDYDLDYFTDQLLPDSVFRGKMVLIGSTVAELHDNFPTPFLNYGGTPRELPGVEIHANALRTILNRLYFSGPPWWLRLLILLLLVLSIQGLCQRFPALWSILITVAAIGLYIGAQFFLFSQFRVVMELVAPSLAMFFTAVAVNLYQYMLTQKEKQLILGAFQQYVPAKVIQELIEHPEKLTLGGEERVLTVLFSDVANFTTISEALAPRQLVALLNDYLSEMTEIILNYDGIIDKYEGDAIMAEFGAPIYYEDHALKACHAALDMQARLRQISRRWRREGRPVLTCRVGINTGNMVVGNMGSRKVFDYTVIGDEVNLAARLEGANKAFGTRIMISESTYNVVKDEMVTRPLDL